jgi:hypothetical protein
MTEPMTEDEIQTTLPGPSQIGDHKTWKIVSGDSLLIFDGVFLGVSSSRREFHDPVHDGSPYLQEGQICSACRWHEPRIFRADLDGQKRWIIHRTGGTCVPGEATRTSHTVAYSAHEVMEVMATRRRGHKPYLTRPAAAVLAQAAGHDEDLDDAWINRVVQ